MSAVTRAMLDGAGVCVFVLQFTADGLSAVVVGDNGKLELVSIERLEITFPIPAADQTEREDKRRKVDIEKFTAGK
jgi:hypothetical protein